MKSKTLNEVKGHSLWSLYDALADPIHEQETVDDFVAGLHWFGVRTGNAVGLAMSPVELSSSISQAGRVRSLSLKAAARMAKSWTPADATLGVAALNSHWNTPFKIQSLMGDETLEHHSDGRNVFELMASRVAGKRVTVVGHFRGLDRLREICELNILERRPQPGDLPDPACEDILPRSDYVFITGTTLMNKTLPRLLSLSQGAFVTVVGPSTPLSPVLFEFGVDMIAGLVVESAPDIWRVVQEGGQHSLFGPGSRMVQFEKRRAVARKRMAS